MRISEKLNKFTDNHRGGLQILTIIIAILPLVASIGLYQNNQISLSESQLAIPKNNKDFSFTLEHNNAMITSKDTLSKLRLFYDDLEVENPFTVMITLQNTGIEPIKIEDFLHPLSIEIDKDVHILDYNIVSSSNKYLSDEVYDSLMVENNTLLSKGFLINQGERVSISFITNRKATNFTINSRFFGIPEIKIYNSPQQHIDERNKSIENLEKRIKQVNAYFIAAAIISFALVLTINFWIISDFSKNKKKQKAFQALCLSYGVDFDCITEESKEEAIIKFELYYAACKKLEYNDEKTKQQLLEIYHSILQEEESNNK